MRHKYYFQQGYGGIEWFLLAVLFGLIVYFFFYPFTFKKVLPGTVEGDNYYCRDILDTADAPTFTDPETNIRYRMIKADVPMNPANYLNDRIYNHFGTSQNYQDPTTGKKYVLRNPSVDTRSGRSYKFASDTDPTRAYDIGFADYGIIMLFHADENYDPLPSYIADIYKAVDKPELPEWVFQCIDKPPPGTLYDQLFEEQGTLEIKPIGYTYFYPEQNWSVAKKEEQLGYFLLKPTKFINHTWWTPHCKPAIYLYPEKETHINVKVGIPSSSFLYTDPLYPKDTGWNVLARPTGDLLYQGFDLKDSKGNNNYPSGIFPYLYYEARIADSVIEKPTQGFIKKYEDMETFYNELLPKLGLNTKEATEFKHYWLNALPTSPYYFIGIVNQDNLDTIEPLTITPKQETTIRVSLYFEALDSFKIITPPNIITPQRNGFTVVEWGGMLKRDQSHPFTCME